MSLVNPERRLTITADHPSLAGHFPGNPIVPGVVILEQVIRAFEAWRPDQRPVGMPVVKFLAPLRPGEFFTIRFGKVSARGIRFDCVRDEGQALVEGFLLGADVSEPPSFQP